LSVDLYLFVAWFELSALLCSSEYFADRSDEFEISLNNFLEVSDMDPLDSLVLLRFVLMEPFEAILLTRVSLMTGKLESAVDWSMGCMKSMV